MGVFKEGDIFSNRKHPKCVCKNGGCEIREGNELLFTKNSTLNCIKMMFKTGLTYSDVCMYVCIYLCMYPYVCNIQNEHKFSTEIINIHAFIYTLFFSSFFS